eukprot:scaffold130095_cov21-Tisochrysis_lutea.AAC.3
MVHSLERDAADSSRTLGERGASLVVQPPLAVPRRGACKCADAGDGGWWVHCFPCVSPLACFFHAPTRGASFAPLACFFTSALFTRARCSLCVLLSCACAVGCECKVQNCGRNLWVMHAQEEGWVSKGVHAQHKERVTRGMHAQDGDV